jgi:ABC-type hemin transport system substrate-binding protein
MPRSITVVEVPSTMTRVFYHKRIRQVEKAIGLQEKSLQELQSLKEELEQELAQFESLPTQKKQPNR